MNMRENILKISRNFRLDISHATYETLDCQGKNTLPLSRIFLILDAKSPNKSYIANHSLTPAQKLTLLPSHIYFMPKDQALEYNFYPGITLIAFHFSMEIFPGIDLFDGDSLFKKTPASKYLIKKMPELWKASNNLGNTAIFYGLIYSILGMFSDKTLRQLKKQRDSMRQFESLMQYVEAKSNAQTSVGELADFCNLPQDTLSKRFIRASGISLKTYLTRLLLRKASQQLISTDLKVKEVSEKLEFSSEYYFCRFFKKHTGMTPNSYRQSMFH
jgi:AraC-like DNA-binding protein